MKFPITNISAGVSQIHRLANNLQVRVHHAANISQMPSQAPSGKVGKPGGGTKGAYGKQSSAS